MKLISTRAAMLGDRIELELVVHGAPLRSQAAAHAAGFPITPEIVEVHSAPAQPPAHGLWQLAPTASWPRIARHLLSCGAHQP